MLLYVYREPCEVTDSFNSCVPDRSIGKQLQELFQEWKILRCDLLCIKIRPFRKSLPT